MAKNNGNQELAINRDALLDALSLLHGCVDRRQTLPILNNVLIEADGNKLALTASNNETQAITRIALDSPAAARFTVDAGKLTDITRFAPADSPVRIAIGKENVNVRYGKSKFKLNSLPADEFPLMPAIENAVEISLPAKSLAALFGNVANSMATHDVRYCLNGLLLELEGTHLRAVGTDGHRLSLSEDEIPVALKETHQPIVPRNAVQMLVRTLDDSEAPVNVSFNQNAMRVVHGQTEIMTKLIDGRYPDYRQAIPRQVQGEALIDRSLLIDAIKRSLIVANEQYKRVGFRFMSDGQITVLSSDKEGDSGEEAIEAQYDGKPIDVGFNGQYLLDALENITDEQVRLHFTGNHNAVRISGANASPMHLVMPMAA